MKNHILPWLFDWFDLDLFLNLFVAVGAVFVLTSIFYQWHMGRAMEEIAEEDVIPVLNTIYAYMATATEEEYDAIVHELRDSLVLRTLDTADLEYLDLIPNTAEACPFDREPGAGSGPVYLAALNMGVLYDISHCTAVSFGYDEISGSRVHMAPLPDGSGASADLLRRTGEISIQRMKRLFCEEHFHGLVDALSGESVLEFALFDASAQRFYPVTESTEYRFDGGAVSVSRAPETGWNDYTLEIRKE